MFENDRIISIGKNQKLKIVLKFLILSCTEKPAKLTILSPKIFIKYNKITKKKR